MTYLIELLEETTAIHLSVSQNPSQKMAVESEDW